MIKHALIALLSVTSAMQPPVPVGGSTEGIEALRMADAIPSGGPTEGSALFSRQQGAVGHQGTPAGRPSEVPDRPQYNTLEVTVRRNIITKFLIENNCTREHGRTFKQVREILRNDPIGDMALRAEITYCCRELGMPIKARSSVEESSRKLAIIEEFVTANSRMTGEDSVALISELLEAEGVGLARNTIRMHIWDTRRKFGLGKRRTPGGNLIISSAAESESSVGGPPVLQQVAYSVDREGSGDQETTSGGSAAEWLPAGSSVEALTGRSRILRRRERIATVLIENHKTGNKGTFKQLRAMFTHDEICDKTLYNEIGRVRRQLGMNMSSYTPRSSAQVVQEGRKMIVNFVEANGEQDHTESTARNPLWESRSCSDTDPVPVGEADGPSSDSPLLLPIKGARSDLKRNRGVLAHGGITHACREANGDLDAGTAAARAAAVEASMRRTTTEVPVMSDVEVDLTPRHPSKRMHSSAYAGSSSAPVVNVVATGAVAAAVDMAAVPTTIVRVASELAHDAPCCLPAATVADDGFDFDLDEIHSLFEAGVGADADTLY